MYPARKRAKRAAVEDLYKSCKLGGDCIPDVVNKVEAKTLADILLQAFGSIIYLGGLGFGTGRGSAGTVSSRAIPETIAPPRITRPTVTKPSRPFAVPLDPISAGRPIDPAAGTRPIDVIDPQAPSIVTLTETVPEIVITSETPGISTGDTTVLTDIDTITDITSIQSHPTVIGDVDSNVAILNVTPSDPPPSRVLYQTPSNSDLSITVETASGHLNPDINVFVDPLAFAENIVFGEEIPLEPINPRAEFEIQDPYQRTSTPLDRLQNVVSRARQYYRRYIQQVETRNPDFIGDVSRAVQFQFENPAFDPEVTLEFLQDVSEVAAAPDPDFTNIQRLGRPTYSTTPEGTVRVSRLGSRAGVTTRRGTLLTQDVHFYYDVSTIGHAEEIELPILNSSNTSTTLITPDTESTFIDAQASSSTFYQDEDLLDLYSETFNDAQLLVEITAENGEETDYPVTFPGAAIKPVVFDIQTNRTSIASSDDWRPVPVPNIPFIPFEPSIGYDVFANDFFLHPSLIRKRKRKRSDSF
uniref:Minor capsid protein L2 n=1 Tax=Human papillomavirus TaxID=10566 RepID=A0A385PMP3_9PAPI|nr:MAG: L2 protein [Human papillomavirus]